MEEYDYKKNIEKLIKRYENKVDKLLENNSIESYSEAYGLGTAVGDLQDILDNIEM